MILTSSIISRNPKRNTEMGIFYRFVKWGEIGVKQGLTFDSICTTIRNRGAAFVNKVIRKEEVMDEKSDSSKLELEYIVVKFKKKKSSPVKPENNS